MFADILVLFAILAATFGLGFVVGKKYENRERVIVLRRLQTLK